MSNHISYITPDEALSKASMTLSEAIDKPSVPACCSEGCMVEPDGECPHGHASVLVILGLI